MSSRYEINYSFLKKDISEKRKKEIYDCINNICERIEKGQINKYEGFLNIADEMCIRDRILGIRNELRAFSR